MTKRFALEYTGQAEEMMEEILGRDKARFDRVVAFLRSYADDPYDPQWPKPDNNGEARITKNGLAKASCIVSGSQTRGGSVITFKIIEIL